MKKQTTWIELPQFELICFSLAKEIYGQLETIPGFITRTPGILESCLETPRQRFNGKFLYPTLVEQAAILFYLLIKNHPFQNGNKRIALTTLLVFLYINGHWIEVSNEELHHLAVEVTGSKSADKDKTLVSIQKLIKDNLISVINKS